ncbi:MAG TPA: hypothetical protein VF756_19680 [Thermoanaerobaculia bacterium]
MTPQADEKICPFCFEVIRIQAIRCRYCHADLSATGSPVSDCSTTGAAHGITIGGQGHHIEGGVHITTLSELEELDPATKAELLALYEGKVRDYPENAKYHFALGLSYLDRCLYDLAITSFKRALGKGLREANLYYYLALAALRGKQPRSHGLNRIKEIESFLDAAIKLEDNPHFLVLWALIKYDFYLSNGLLVPPPSIEDLLTAAICHDFDVAELRLIAKHVPLPDSPITRTILARA